jgi:hypothetical protein
LHRHSLTDTVAIGENAVIHGIEVWADTIDWGKTVIAVGGGIAGTAGTVKTLQEIWSNLSKRRLAVERELTGSVDVGNTVNIANLTDKPILVSNVEVVWARWRPWGRTITHRPTDFNWENGFTIEPHGRRSFNYSGADYFPSGHAAREAHGRLFFLVWMTGDKKPKWFDID